VALPKVAFSDCPLQTVLNKVVGGVDVSGKDERIPAKLRYFFRYHPLDFIHVALL
jgi:hypothetical protein